MQKRGAKEKLPDLYRARHYLQVHHLWIEAGQASGSLCPAYCSCCEKVKSNFGELQALGTTKHGH